jgi:hypothetical protein
VFISPLELVSTPQVFPLAGGQSGSLNVYLQFATAPSAGIVSVEYRRPSSTDWVFLQNGNAAPIISGSIALKIDGGISAIRVTFAGLTGGALPLMAITESSTATPPKDLMTDNGFGASRRLRVDNGQTGFFARRMWSLNYEFASTNPIADTPLVFRFTIPVNFIIHAHSLSLDQGGMTLRTYSAAQGAEGGTFSATHTPVSENSMTENAAYTFQTVIASGGTFTPTVGQVPLTPLRVRTANATAQQSSVGGEAVSEKGRSSGVYYAVLARMTGVTGDCTGVYTVVIEERPAAS